MRFLIALLTYLLVASSALAIDLAYLMEDEAPRYNGIPDETEFYANRALVQKMRGIVSGGWVQFFVDGRTIAASSITLDTDVFNGSRRPCIRYGSECFKLSNSLSPESVVRISHWAYQAKFKAFSCIQPNHSAADGLRRSGLVDLGRSSIARCGNEFIAPELNSAQLRAIARHIDFGSGANHFADLNSNTNCTTPSSSAMSNGGTLDSPNNAILLEMLRRQREAERSYEGLLGQRNSSDDILNLYREFLEGQGSRSQIIINPSNNAAIDSTWVNIDLSRVYRAELVYRSADRGGSFIRFSARPQRHLWELPRTGAARVLKRCEANDPSLSTREAVQHRAIRFFQVAAIIRTLGENGSRDLAAEINRQIDEF